MKIYHYPRCSKSRQTLSILEEAGVEPEVIEYLKKTPSEEELKAITEMLGIAPSQLVRKSESVYKEQFKGADLDDAEWIRAMVRHPKLIQRPIVVKGDRAVIGRPPEKVRELL